MLNKLLLKDLKKNMHWMWILFISTIAIAGITRGFKELGKTNPLYKTLADIVEKNGGVWCEEAESYLLKNAKKINA